MKTYFRNIIFSKTPLVGKYKFRKEFRIFPAPFTGLPQSEHTLHFPLVIESWVNDEENPELPAELNTIENLLSPLTNQTNKVSRISNLLSALSNHRFFQYKEIEDNWGIPIPAEGINEELNTQSSAWTLGLYYYPNMAQDLRIEHFTVSNAPDITFIEHPNYFLDDPVENKDGEITFSERIDSALKGYYSLDKYTKTCVDSAAYLICNGTDIRPAMKSLSFLSLISSIETLMTLEFKSKMKEISFICHDCRTIESSPYKCPKCDRPIWGIAVKFREFLKKYVSATDASERKYKKIYKLRSKIIHNGALLLGDSQIDWDINGETGEQWQLHLETLQSIQLFGSAISNWDLHLRCVNFITILESIFLKDEEDTKMEQKVKARLSKSLSNQHTEKERIKSLFSNIYQVRHKMIHKALRIKIDYKELSEAQKIMINLFLKLIQYNIVSGFTDKARLIEKLNEIKS